MTESKYQRLLKTLGPGILFASTCIGVSHLVQSTRAGANYGFMLVGAILLANIFKYPFFEFASRYTSATGKSIIDGYYSKNKWILGLYLIITLSSMFIVTAAVTFVTAGLLSNIFSVEFSIDVWSAIILSVCAIILIGGRFKLLDSVLKLVGGALLISTIVAFFSAITNGKPEPTADFITPELFDSSGILFIIALMGWMPTAIDMSTWTSLWTEARIKQTGYKPQLKETLFEFNIGYLISAILALCFLTLGALIIYGNETPLPNSSTAFANTLIEMFTTAIGDWSYYIILLAAFSAMFSTTITVMDGYGRSTARAIKLLRQQLDDSRTIYIVTLIILVIITYFVIAQYLNNLKSLVDFATTLSFVVAPLAGYLNYRMIYDKDFPESHVPKSWLKGLAIAGLIFLSVFTLIFFFVKLRGIL